MMLSASIQGLGGLEALASRLARFSSRGLIRNLGNIAKKAHERRVLSEKTSPDGAAWAALKPATVEKKGSAEIMVETGRLAKSFVNTVSGDLARIWNMARSERGAAYLIFHQAGTRHMVARPIIGLSERNIEEIRMAANAFVLARLGL